MESLGVVSYRRQGLESIPLEAGSKGETLDLSDNAITSVEGASWQTRLAGLYLGRNALSSFACGQQLQHLESLDLSDNKLHILQIGALAKLQFLNLAGNDFRNIEAIGDVQNCSRLRALDLSRNLFDSCPSPALRGLPALQLVSLLGNPYRMPQRIVAQLPNLLIWNGRVLPGKSVDAASLIAALPQLAGFTVLEHPEVPGYGLREGYLQGETAGASVTQHTASSSAHHEGSAMYPRRSSGPVQDSADDMSSAGRSHSSGSEHGGGLIASDPTQASHLGLVERQDSANYQPRPPALAERQDSAQVLQALAEDEAALTASGSLAETPSLARQDSARELGDIVRSPSPRTRRAASPGFFSHVSMEANPTSPMANFSLHAVSAPDRSSRPDLCVSPRQDSASDRQGYSGPGGLHVDRSRRPDRENAQLGTSADTDAATAAPRQATVALGSVSPFQQSSHASLQESTPRQAGGTPSRCNSLEEARQLLAATGGYHPQPRAEPQADLQAEGATIRQDSALDTLSEARRVAQSEIPQSDYPSVSSSDPLLQARKLYQETVSSSPRSIPLSRQPTAERLPSGPLEKPLLRVGQRLSGPLSPFEGPLTPLSPAWTTSQLQSGFLQLLPSIESGLPWTLSTSGSTQPSSSGHPSAAEGNLLAEARRVVLGNESASRVVPPCGSSGLAGPIKPQEEGSCREWVDATLTPVRVHTGTRSGAIDRETPYPDSPLAAPTAAEHGASLQSRGYADMAGPSK